MIINKWMWCWIAVTGMMVMTTTGCAAVKVGDKTAAEVFKNPQTLALVEAGCRGDIGKIDNLVKQGANVNAVGHNDMTVLVWVMMCHNHLGAKRLVELGANPNFVIRGFANLSAMYLSAGSSDPYWLPLLIEHGGNVNIRAGYRTALMVAIEQDRAKNIQLLLDHGVDVNEHDEGGNSAATMAAALAKFNILEMLLKRGYNYNLERLAIGVNGRVVAPKFAAEKQHVLDMLKERGVKFPLPPPTVAPPAPGTKPPSWWHPKTSSG